MGEPWDAVAWLNGIKCQSLIELRKLPVIQYQSFYQQHLSNRKLHLINKILDVEGAAGQLVPYLGDVTVHIKFLAEECGTNATITTLALVCPDQKYNAKSGYQRSQGSARELQRTEWKQRSW